MHFAAGARSPSGSRAYHAPQKTTPQEVSPRTAQYKSGVRTTDQLLKSSINTADIISELRRFPVSTTTNIATGNIGSGYAAYELSSSSSSGYAPVAVGRINSSYNNNNNNNNSSSIYPNLSETYGVRITETPVTPSAPVVSPLQPLAPFSHLLTTYNTMQQAQPPQTPQSSTHSEHHGISSEGGGTGNNSGASSSMGGKAIMPTSQIEMTISCRNLCNKDILSKSDPYCLILMKDSWQEKFVELGRTETIRDSLNPEWVKKFILDYNFEMVQRIRFEIWDLDPNGKDFLGYHETSLAEIVSFASRQYVRPLSGSPDKRNGGDIVIVTEELSSCKQIVQLQFAAEGLPRAVCGLFRPDPFLVISRSNEDGTFSVVIKSEPVRSNKAPIWLPINMRVRTLCNGDYERTIKIDCYDSRQNGKHVLFGSVFTSLRELIANSGGGSGDADGTGGSDSQSAGAPLPGPNTGQQGLSFSNCSTMKKFPLQPPPSKENSHQHHSSPGSRSAAAERRRHSRNSQMDSFVGGAGGPRSAKTKTETPAPTLGNLLLREITVTEEITFIDYIKSGTQMHFAVAIDFTASNGPPRDPHSLHFLDTFGGKPNPYEIALRAVGEIIQQYDSAGMFPAFGFGAKLPPNGDVSHQFSLNGNASHPYCSSISEIVTHYRNCLATVTLYGPTNFSLVIHNTAQIASKFQDGKHYFILLIITDGIISDIHQTKNAIIDASGLPISIIIVGVGNADFAAMDELDSDDIKLGINGRYAERDIVQFVPLNKFLSRTGPYIRSQAELAREVLAEIPDQMTGYMKTKGFIPSPMSQKNK